MEKVKKWWSKNRYIILFFIGVIEAVIIYLNWAQVKNNNTLVVALVGAIPAYCLWIWRDQNKLKDQDHVERKLSMEETNNDWENFTKFQNMVWGMNNEPYEVKAAAIYALGEYYSKPLKSNFPKQVHMLFRMVLKEYWKNEDADSFDLDIVAPHILAIHEVIKQKIEIFEKDLVLHNFNFTWANFYAFDFKGKSLTFCDFSYAELIEANLQNVNLTGTNLRNTKLLSTNLEQAQLSGTKYNDHTLFPNGFNPETHKMEKVD